MTSGFKEIEAKISALEKDWDGENALPEGTRLYHFTSPEGLAGILSSGSIWATLATALSDMKELQHLAKPVEHKHEEERLKRRLQRTIVQPRTDYLVDPIEDPVGAWRQAGGPFLVCFCAACQWEQVDDLYFWRTFGQEGKGYALGFELKRMGPFTRNPASHLAKVLYDEVKSNDIKTRILTLDDEVGSAAERERKQARSEGGDGAKMKSRISKVGRWETSQARRLHRALLELQVCHKSRSFQIERESRLIVTGNKDERKIRTSAGGLVPFVEYPISIPGRPYARRQGSGKQVSLKLSEVVMGPAANSRVSEPSLRFLLSGPLPKKGEVEIYQSKLTIR